MLYTDACRLFVFHVGGAVAPAPVLATPFLLSPHHPLWDQRARAEAMYANAGNRQVSPGASVKRYRCIVGGETVARKMTAGIREVPSHPKKPRSGECRRSHADRGDNEALTAATIQKGKKLKKHKEWEGVGERLGCQHLI